LLDVAIHWYGIIDDAFTFHLPEKMSEIFLFIVEFETVIKNLCYQ